MATSDLLPLSPEIGWVYNIESESIYGQAGMNVAWNGTLWDPLGPVVDTSQFLKENEIAEWAKQPQKPIYTANEVGAMDKITVIQKSSSDTNVTLEANKYYVFPEISSLIVQLATNNGSNYAEYHFTFTSGGSPTTLTLPENVKSDMAIEANRIYEVSIANNLLAWTSWAV